MGFTALKPYEGKPQRTGVRARLSRDKHMQYVVRLSFSAVAQKRWFDHPIKGATFDITVGRGQDHGRLKIVKADKGAFCPLHSGYGSVYFKIAKWDTLPNGVFPAEDCKVLSCIDDVIIMLPKWAQGHQKSNTGVSLP